MIEGLFAPVLRDIDYLTPSAPYPATPSGIMVHQKPIYRYNIPTEDYPTLTILDYIPDYNGNFIKPGHYELALSGDKEFLYLLESKNLIAVIPVFKLAENKSELKRYYEKNKDKLTKSEQKYLKKKKRQEKLKKVIETKYAETGASVPREYVHMEADIEYVPKGGYYLIRYEKGFIRAWGAIKIKTD